MCAAVRVWKSRSTNGVSPSLKAGERDVQLIQTGRDNSPFLCLLFYLGPQRIRWCTATSGRAVCSTQSTDRNVNLTWKHLHGHSQKKMFNQISGHPMSQSSQKLSITSPLPKLFTTNFHHNPSVYPASLIYYISYCIWLNFTFFLLC